MIFRIAAIVLFILAAVFLLFVDDIELKTDFGLIAIGLACLAAEPFNDVIRGRT